MGYRRETRGSTEFSPPVRSFEEIEKEGQKYQQPRVDDRQVEKDSKSISLHMRAKAVIDSQTFNFRLYTNFKSYD